jgi:hypothetical protein
MAGGKANPLISNVLNATLPTGTGGAPGTWTAYAAGAMKLRYNSTLSTTSAAGTELAGTGYTTGGAALGQSTASSGASAVTLPASAITITNGSGSPWSIASLDVTDSAAARAWWGPFNAQPISIGIGNSFQVAANAVSASDG